MSSYNGGKSWRAIGCGGASGLDFKRKTSVVVSSSVDVCRGIIVVDPSALVVVMWVEMRLATVWDRERMG